ncbi:hypothetical protein PCK1_000423 [Pneumocystis canis]|nr:hypothetical protein PCK1_000423 [Pneumocystis canis]
MKQKLNILDLISIVSELQKLIGLRLQNIYDISERTFQFKFTTPGYKKYLLVESGARIHLTCYTRETTTLPSQFCTKLRKHLKSKQLVSLEQIGNDRVVYLGFGRNCEAMDSFKPLYYLIFEFYAAGNILLTDGDMKILSLLRIVRPGGMHQQFSVGEIYKITSIPQDRQIKEMTKDILLSLINTLRDKYLDYHYESLSEQTPLSFVSKKISKKGKNSKELPLKRFISWELNNYGNSLIEHIIRDADINPDMKIEEFYRNIESINLDHLLLSFQRADELIKKCKEGIVTGYIIEKIESKFKTNDFNYTEMQFDTNYIKVYVDFNPFIPKQFSNNPDYSIIRFDNDYNACIDKYFSSLESQKFYMKLKNQEDNAYQRLQAVKEEHQKKITDLQNFQDICIKKAKAIEENLEIVDETIKAVNSCILQSMDWEDIAKLIETEKEYGNPAAAIIILPLKLNLNTITIKLPSPCLDNIFKEEQNFDLPNSQIDLKETLNIDIKLTLNAWANSRDYYDKKKAASIKEEKTIAASSKALKNAERKIKSDLKKNISQEKKKLVPMRNLRWFEKFLWFISSDGYLVLGGHDFLQNKILIEKHFCKNDIYVHADLKDAAVVIIKNIYDSVCIPPSTLNQAGAFSITKSNAWTNKIVTSAWWVYYDQVLKFEETEGNSFTGVFTIQGKKNFLSPSQLILGYGILWTIDEASKMNRLKNKLSRDNQNDLLLDTMINQETISVIEKMDDFSLNDKKQEIDISDIKIDEVNMSDFEKFKDQKSSSVKFKNTLIIENSQGIINDSKYNLEEYVESSSLNSNQIISSICASHQKIEKKRISIKERRNMKNRQMKKDQELSDNNKKIKKEGSELQDVDLDVKKTDLGLKLSNANKLKEKTTLLSTNVRGKKGKMKKIMLKYADQDEDDRALRMELLGSSKSSKKKDQNLKNDKKIVINKNTKISGQNSDYDNKKSVFQNNFEKKNNQLLKKENFEVTDDKEKNYEINLDAFVFFPLPNDILIEAIPICAPYSSMVKYKYKIKLQPGTMKKGKAIRNIIAYWDTLPVDPYCKDQEKAFPKEKELIQSLKDSELLAPVYVSTFKTMMGKNEINISTKTKSRNLKKI